LFEPRATRNSRKTPAKPPGINGILLRGLSAVYSVVLVSPVRGWIGRHS
jgi:hypothetical protein